MSKKAIVKALSRRITRLEEKFLEAKEELAEAKEEFSKFPTHTFHITMLTENDILWCCANDLAIVSENDMCTVICPDDSSLNEWLSRKG